MSTAALQREPRGRVGAVNPVGGVVLPCTLAAGGVLALMLTGDDTASQIIGLSLGIFFVGLSGAFIISRETGLRTALSRGKFGPWASLSFGIVFGLASLQWLQVQDGLAAMLSRDSVVSALWAALFGQIAWTIGYLIAPLRLLSGLAALAVRVAVPPRDAGKTWGTAGVWALFALGLVGQFIRFRTNQFGYLTNAAAGVTSFSSFGQLTSFLSNMGTFAIVVAAANYWSPARRGSVLALFVVTSTQMGFGLVQASKETFAVAALAAIFGYASARRRLPVAALLAGVLFFSAVVVPFVTAYRAVARVNGNSDIPTAIRAVPSVAADQAFGATSENLSLFAARLRLIDSLAIVEQRSPDQVPYLPLSDLALQPAVGLVPRFLWPGKPGFTTGYDFGQKYYFLPTSFLSADAVTPPADLYRRGGLVVLILGMLAFGGLYRLVDDSITPELDVRHVFIVVALFPLLVKHEVDVGSLLLSLPVALVGIALASRVLAAAGRQA